MHYIVLIILLYCAYIYQNLVALNLWGNKLEDAETIIQEVTKCRRLKAIWLNDNRALRDW